MTGTNDEHVDFFISRAGADSEWAEWIAWELEEAGFTTRLQDWDFGPGSNFVVEMDNATKDTERTIAVLSSAYLDAKFTKPEWTAAFRKDPTGEKGLLVPVLIDRCDVEGLLGPIVYIDLVGLDESAARERLLSKMQALSKGQRGKPGTKPGFPGGSKRADRPPFPGSFPDHWNVPHIQNPNFTGRDDMLASLHDGFVGGTPLQAVHGIGGAGKSSVAVEYAYRYRADYEMVWWVRAESETTILSDVAALAVERGLVSENDPDLPGAAQKALGWLRRSGGWLLVFDNAEPWSVSGHLPHGGDGHVLVTSRSPLWGGIAHPEHLDEFDRLQSVAFLLRRTGHIDEEAANRIADTLGNLPLALEQAGAYVEASGTSLSAYADLAGARLAELMAEGQPPGYPATVATTWNLSFIAVEVGSPAAADLLRLCAFVAPDDIPLDLVRDGVDLPGTLASLADPVAMDRAVASLRRHSLIERRGDRVSVHRLVQAVTRDRLGDAAAKFWTAAATEVVDRAFPYGSDDVRTWEACERLLPHALVAANHAERFGVAYENSGRLLNHAGLYLVGRARYAEARVAFERALAIGEAATGPDHPNVGAVVNNLGILLKDLGDLAAARAVFERALAIAEGAYGPNHPSVATAINNLGEVLWAVGDLAAARAAFERALAIDEAAYGPNDAQVAPDVNNLGTVLRDLGDLAGARVAFGRALAIAEGAYGPDHPTVATAIGNVGGVLRTGGDLAGARAAFERALAIDEAVYGSDHPEVATDLNNLATVLQELGDLAGTRVAVERALAISESTYGPDHPSLAAILNNLGSLMVDLGDLAAAMATLQRALAIAEAAYGPDHPSVANIVNNLGSLLRELGDLAGARAAFERALTSAEATYGAEHPLTQTARHNLQSL
jgi:tetratricopeptide (TPR) repeat protein